MHRSIEELESDLRLSTERLITWRMKEIYIPKGSFYQTVITERIAYWDERVDRLLQQLNP